MRAEGRGSARRGKKACAGAARERDRRGDEGTKNEEEAEGEGGENEGGKAEAGFRTRSVEKSEGGDHGQRGRRGGGTKQSVRGLLVFLENC